METSDIKNDPNWITVSEKFDRIAKGIELRWGTKDLDPYVSNLLNDTRDHTRNGFPRNVAKALTDLLIKHANLYPQFTPPPKSVWDINFSS